MRERGGVVFNHASDADIITRISSRSASICSICCRWRESEGVSKRGQRRVGEGEGAGDLSRTRERARTDIRPHAHTAVAESRE